MGDWNPIVGEGGDGQEVGAFGIGTRNERDHLVDFYRQHDMTIG